MYQRESLEFEARGTAAIITDAAVNGNGSKPDSRAVMDGHPMSTRREIRSLRRRSRKIWPRHWRRPGSHVRRRRAKLVILKLLSDQPSYGYQLIKALEERLAGG